MLYIDGTEKVPAKDGGKGKEQKAYSNENIAERAENSRKCVLGQHNAVFAAI